MEWLTNPDIWMSFLTLCILEIILGIDNIIFISIISQKLPKEQQGKARTWGLGFALITRILLLLSITWIMQLTSPLITILENEISGRDIILILGGLFLIYKSVLSFLIMIGLALLADGLDFHIPKGYIYFSMAFALMVEAVNITISKRKRR